MWNVFYAGYWTDLNILKDTFKGLGATLPPYYRSWNESVLGVMLGNHPSYGHHKKSYVCAKYFSCGWLFVTPWTVAYQAPLSMEFSRQGNWSGLSFSSPGDLPDPGIEIVSLMYPALAGMFFTTSTTWQIPKEGWAPKTMLSNCGVGEEPWESLGLQGDQTSQS